MAENSDNCAVLDHLGEISLNDPLSVLILPLLSILGECFLLTLIPKANMTSDSLITELLAHELQQ